jgi:hypothetical protein
MLVRNYGGGLGFSGGIQTDIKPIIILITLFTIKSGRDK